MNTHTLASAKTILVISYGPVPTPEFQKIEGGGMRCWGLALGLRDNGHAVTVSVFNEFKQTIKSHKGIGLHNWTLNDEFKEYINTFDAVIVSYSMGDLSVFVADNLSHHVTLVLDCYVPIFIEISARDSDDKAGELRGYLYEVERFNHVLKRGDFFICANEPQKHMYMGILGSLGIINPHSYRQHRVLLVPFGVEDEPEQKNSKWVSPYKVTSDKGFVLLWFGGLYPWFNFEPLIEAVKILSKNPEFKFYLVGGKNPYNAHPDFVKQYDYVLTKFTELGLMDKSVFFVDWIDFDDRLRWYRNADLVISINSPGEENVYSWRTRVMDYIWGELPMLTNGGDPLSDELIDGGAAVKISLSSKEIAEIIGRLIAEPRVITDLQKNLVAIKDRYRWVKVTKPLSDQLLSNNNLPFVEGLAFMEEHRIDRKQRDDKTVKLKAVARKAGRYAAKAREKGLKRSAKFAAKAIVSQTKSTLKPRRLNAGPKAIFLSHPIDHTGAPLVLLDVVKDFGEALGEKAIHLVAPAIEKSLLNSLLTKDYKIHKMAAGIGGRFIQASLQINPDDFVLMNTIALYQNYKDYVYWMLETGKLKHAHWFIHEDNPSTRFGNKQEIARIKRLLAENKLTILVPSVQTASDYKEFFETNAVHPVTLRVQVPAKYQKLHSASNYDIIKFFISGIPLDGRKGQLLFLAALQIFESKYKTKNPESYRPYTLDLVAIGKDYISQQILSIGKAVLNDDSFRVHPIVERDTALKIAYGCNVTVCSSLNETFALYVAEGMLMGHPVLRNKTSGWQEQVKDNKNGFMFETLSVEDLAESIAKILDKSLSNEALAKMGKESQRIASSFNSSNYYNQIAKK